MSCHNDNSSLCVGLVDAGTYAISLLDEVDGQLAIKHYSIKNLDNGGFFITTKHTFKSLDELVTFYSSKYYG